MAISIGNDALYLQSMQNASAAKTEKLIKKINSLESIKNKIPSGEAIEVAGYYRTEVLGAMEELREIADELETLVAKEYWPFPTYTELLYNV